MISARLRAYFYLTITALIWAFGGVVIKVTLKELSPAVFLTYRFFISSLVVIPILLMRKIQIPKKVNYFKLFIVSLFGTTINVGLLFYGAKLTTVNDLAVISAVAPIMVIIAGAIFLKEHMVSMVR